MKETIDWKDINITASFEFENTGTPQVSFKLYEITGEYEDGVQEYELKGAKSSGELTKVLWNAQTLMEGHIKWDGCSHVQFGDETGYIHLCGIYSWNTLHTAIARTWEYARLKLAQDHTQNEFSKSLLAPPNKQTN